MAVNQYFNLYNATNEQTLVENMVVETIQSRGFDAYYIPQNDNLMDYLTGDNPGESYRAGFPVEMMLESIDSFGGDNVLMSKFGLDIEDTATLIVAKKRFKEEAIAHQLDHEYPIIGDLIYIPMSKSLCTITQVPTEEPFYQLGKNYVYKLKLHAFNYSSQTFNTGIPELDQGLENMNTANKPDLSNVDYFADNDSQKQESLVEILDLSKDNPFLKT